MRIAVWQQVDASHLGSMAMLQSDRYRADFCWALGRAHLAADERFPDAKLRAQHGKTQMVGIPVRLSETPGSVRSAAPEFGQHTEEVLIDLLGYDWDRLTELRKQEVI